MTTPTKQNCPSSEEFFYWPPEEIAHYKNWCEVGNLQHKRRLNKVKKTDKRIRIRN